MKKCDFKRGNSAIEVRDTIINCFYEAHKDLIAKSVDLPQGKKVEFTRATVFNMVKDQFAKTGGDFDKPTKESLFFVIVGLAEIARSFRDMNLIIEHFISMLELIKKIKD